MALTIHVDVVSVEQKIFSGEVEYAAFPGESGELGVLPRHTQLLTRIVPGTVRLKLPGNDNYELIYVSGGLLEIQPTQITLLADTAIRAQGLDEAKAIEAKRRAEEASQKDSRLKFAAAEAELAQVISRIKPLKNKK